MAEVLSVVKSAAAINVRFIKFSSKIGLMRSTALSKGIHQANNEPIYNPLFLIPLRGWEACYMKYVQETLYYFLK
jgi:hypothetical protein